MDFRAQGVAEMMGREIVAVVVVVAVIFAGVGALAFWLFS